MTFEEARQKHPEAAVRVDWNFEMTELKARYLVVPATATEPSRNVFEERF